MQLIEHRIYGRGRIQKSRFGGFELYVKFEDGIERWVRRDEIRFLSETPILIKHKSSELVLSDEQFKARQIIEALRWGIVPHKYVEEFTFGRKEEIREIKNWLDNSNDGSLAIIGEYGVGKTHLLEDIYSFALNNNWAVSIVELDPNEAPFYRPRVIYQKIISSFRFKQKNGDFREFLRQIANSPYFYELEDHKYLSIIIDKIKDGTDDEDMWEWIEGEPTYFSPPMYDKSTCANIYCYLLSGIGWAAKNILKMRGLLILFDEAESVESYWYSSYQNNKVWNFLKGLILMAGDDKKLLKEVQEGRFNKQPIKGVRGNYTDLQYCGYNQLPFIWRIPCSVKIIFAFTPIFDQIQNLYGEPLNTIRRLELEHLDKQVLTEILKSIIRLYKIAYNFEYNNDFSNYIPVEKTKEFVKGVIEALDLKRHNLDKTIEELLKR